MELAIESREGIRQSSREVSTMEKDLDLLKKDLGYLKRKKAKKMET